MHGVGPSTVLGGRYAVQRRLEQLPHAERWSAHDLTLERDVVVVCFRESETHAPATLDAARRAAGLDNHRLVRILDVGRSEGIAFFIEEAVQDGQTLAHLLEQGALPAEEARRIAGEAATALESARSRGLHHLRLTPQTILRAHDGSIKVRGVATAAAMASADDVASTEASRIDAVGVVAVTYAALTSRWPLEEAVPGLKLAPRVVGGVPAPSEIAAGVPGDLDTLCRLTLNEDEGPLTPGDFATQIAPWANAQVVGLGGTATRDQDEFSETSPTIALPVHDLPRETGPTDGRTTPTPTPESTTPMPVPPRPTTPTADREVAADDQDLDPGRADGEGDANHDGALGTGAAAAATASAAASAVGSAIGSAGQAAGHAAGAAGHAAGAAAGAAAQRMGLFAKAAADKAADRRAQRQAAEERAEGRRVSLDDALVDDDLLLDPPLPMLSPESGRPPTRDQSKLVMVIVVAFVVVALFFGFVGASKIGSHSDLGLSPGTTPKNTVTVTGTPATVTPTTPADTASTGEPFPILGATGFDPEGDGSERNNEAPRVYDGKDSTYWSSEGYASANLGGLKKGVGVRVDLGQVRSVSEVTLVTPSASDLTVYVGGDRTLDSAKAIGTSKDKTGTITLKVQGDPVQGQYVFVWFTSVSKVSDGRFRATLAEVTVS